MIVLGISGYYHDSAAALVIDGQVIAAAQEERFSRIKYDFSFPVRSIQFCLQAAGLAPSQLDAVVFFEKPLRKLERVFQTVFAEAPLSLPLFVEASYNWTKEKLWVRERIIDFLKIPREKVFFIPHHLSHAASAFFCSPFTEAAIVTADGVGEWATASLSHGKGDSVELLRELYFPHSLGLLYSTFTTFLGFRVNEENKVMGLAAYGADRFKEQVDQVVTLREDGSLELGLSYFSFTRSRKQMFSRRFAELFGEPRPSDRRWIIQDGRLASEDQVYADLAASVQHFTEEALHKMAVEAHRLTGSPNLCLAGGVALNCVANSYVLQRTPFKKVFIQPAAGDAGGAMGAALYFARSEGARPFLMEHAYWGAEYGNDEIEEALSSFDWRRLDESELVEQVARDIADGKIVGWYRGRCEWGPRALGHRSLLARPDSIALKDYLNREIKKREPFRPFAPSIIAEQASDYFELGKAVDGYPTKFMLLTATCRQPEPLAGALQVDGTARLQVVEPEDDTLYHALLEEVGQLTGVSAVLNTSLNPRGEPIVNRPAEAVDFFRQEPIDVLVMNDYYVNKS